MSAIGGGFNRSTQHLLILPGEEVCVWKGMHGYGSRRGRRLSSGSAGRAVNVWPTSRERLRGGTRAASIGSWLSMAESLQHHVGRVAQKLALQWSPEQVSGWLKRQFPADQGMQVSYETIYRCLFIQTRGVLKKELMAHLRTARQMRQAQGGTTKSGLGQIVDTVSIRERPAEVEDRAVPGHWEGDLLSGANNTHIVTLVERHTRFVMLLKVPSKDTATVVAALGKHVRKLPQELRRSLTWDRGKEMADHKSFTVATNVQVYFCDPRSPWQRGSNENTNGLLRQYFPRGTDLSRFSQAYLNRIALRLNQRPRKTLGFESPADRLQAVLH